MTNVDEGDEGQTADGANEAPSERNFEGPGRANAMDHEKKEPGQSDMVSSFPYRAKGEKPNSTQFRP